MKKITLIILCFMIFAAGCAGLKTKKISLDNGISREDVFKTWGQPKSKTLVGLTPNTNYPVEVWGYYEKEGFLWFTKEKNTLLIFVDGELYFWAVNNPKLVFEKLEDLGVIKKGDYPLDQQYLQSLQSAAEQAQKIQQLMEVINTYKSYQNTQQQIYNMQIQQQLRIYQQRNSLPPPPPQPAKQQKQ